MAPRIGLLLLCGCALSFGQDALKLWYRQPAAQWVEALPVGNGRMGAMVFGGVQHERIQFNESTVWTGGPHDYAHHGAYRYLGQIRELLFAGKQAEAEKLAFAEFMSVPVRQKAYQAFGDVLLDFDGARDATEYRRELDLITGVATTEFTAGGVKYRREVLASQPDQVVAIRLTASKAGALNFTAALKSAHSGASLAANRNEISMSGPVEDSAIRYEARLVVRTSGGKRVDADGKIAVTGADSATLLLAGATNFVNYRDVSGDPRRRNSAVIGAATLDYDALRRGHLADYQKLFGRVTLDLGGSAAATKPTDQRIREFAEHGDPALIALLFQYGRYLMIASSRPGGQPANLQGVWNDSNKPAWDSKYTININTEMNYWPVESTNLSECHQPLFDALKDLSQAGAITAKEQYNARGWVVHHNFDLWRGTAPINASNHGIWPTGGAWLATHLWEHFMFTGDRAFLRDTAYPLMKDAALLFVDALVKDPRSGHLISGPSNSPEQGGLVMGPTMDHEIIRTLFGEVIAASELLDVDAGIRKQLAEMRGRIAPHRIGKYGQLQEWIEDKDDPKNQHRHVSHLWAIFPGGEITPYGSADLFAAARKSLEYRGDAATGWSMGWKINLWAKFLDGDHAYKILQNLIQPASNVGGGTKGQAGLFPNLFDAHPPFQIDGNFGASSGIAEMLLQSQDPHASPDSLTDVQRGQKSFVWLLPALPRVLGSGKVTGLRARGGLEVDIEWRDGRLVSAAVKASASKATTVRYGAKQVEFAAQAGKTYLISGDLKVN